MTERLRVFLVDDHDVARAGARHYLEDRFDIVGEADNAIDAAEMIVSRRPDLV
ncbi:MAG: DNA-binding response regulator, partial [Acidimicrobiia bacterium]